MHVLTSDKIKYREKMFSFSEPVLFLLRESSSFF